MCRVGGTEWPGVTGTKAQSLSIRSTGSTEAVAPSRVHFIAGFVVVLLGLMSVTGTFADKPLRPITYVAAIFGATLVLTVVAKEHIAPVAGMVADRRRRGFVARRRCWSPCRATTT
jgi:hypothetical protein